MAAKDSTQVQVVDYEQAQNKAQEVEKEAVALLSSAEGFEIQTEDQYVSSADLLQRIKSKAKAMEELRKSLTRPLDEAKSRIMDLFRPTENNLEDAENTIKRAMLGYQREEERKRKALEDEARALAAKEAERLQRQADKARAKGKDDRADELEEQAQTMPVPIVPSQAAKVSGVAIRETWKAEVTDLELLVLAVATNKVPIAALMPNMQVLNAQARSLKNELNWPGVRAITEGVVAARGKS